MFVNFGGVAGVGAALGETPASGELPVLKWTAGPQANFVQLPITGASRWSSPGHPADANYTRQRDSKHRD